MARENSSEGKPYDRVAEEAVMGSILVNPNMYEKMASQLEPTNFFIDRHRWILEAFVSLRRQNLPIDVLTVSNELDRKNRLREVGGDSFLADLVNFVPVSLNGAAYLQQVNDLALRRQLLTFASHIAKHASEDGDAINQLNDIEQEFAMLRKNVRTQVQIELLSANSILTTEWSDPIWIIQGLLPVGLAVLAGKAKIGKSWLALQLAHEVSSGGTIMGDRVASRPVLYLALEDPKRRLSIRMKKQGWKSDLPVDFLPISGFEDQIGDLRKGGGKLLASIISEKGYGLVIIDTFSRSIHGDQSDVDGMTRALEPIQAAAHDTNSAILVVDHHKKDSSLGPDAILDVLGSTAKGAVPDTMWGLYRERGKAHAVLQIVGRDIEDRKVDMTFSSTNCTWQFKAKADEFNITPKRREILEALEITGKARIDEILEHLAPEENRGNTYTRLADLVHAGLVTRTEDGTNVYYELLRTLLR